MSLLYAKSKCLSFLSCIILAVNIPTANLFSQGPVLRGIVIDIDTEEAIEDVNILIVNANIHSHTDKSGCYILNIDPGKHQIIFNKTGYEKVQAEILINEGEEKTFDIRLKSKSFNLRSIDISADRPVTAASSKYLSQLDFSNRPKNSAQEMLRLVPGLFIAQHAGGGKAEQIFVRGFDCDHGTDVASFMDGIPVNMPSHGHGQGYADLHFLIPETVEGLNIFKGPYSPRFGDFATGAAVEFNTADTLNKNLFKTETTYTTRRNTLTSSRVLGIFRIPVSSDKTSSYFATEYTGGRGYFISPQDFRRINLFSKTTIAVTDNSWFQFALSGFSSSWNASGQIPERSVFSGKMDRFGSINDTEGGKTHRNNFSISYKSLLNGNEFKMQVYAFDYSFKLFSDFTFFLRDRLNGDQIEQDDNRAVKGMNIQHSHSHRMGQMENRFTIGGSFRADDIENQLWTTTSRLRLDPVTHSVIRQTSTGIFMNEVFRFNDRFRIETGLRFDYFIFDVSDLIENDSLHEDISGYNYQSLLSPKLNFIYSFNDHTQLFLNSGIGYHSNDARSVVQDKEQHNLPMAIGAEAGYLQHFRNLTFSAALWWMDLSNELVYVGDEGVTENRGSSRRTGIDINVRAQINSWLSGDMDVNLSKNIFLESIFGSEVKQGEYVPLAPVFSSTGGLTMLHKNLHAGIRYRFMKERPANEFNTVQTRSYAIIDFTTGYSLGQSKLNMTIENLLDSNWNEAQFDTESRLQNESQPVSELHFTPGTPLSVKLTFSYSF